MFNILDVPLDIEAKKCKINDDGKLEVVWSVGNHTSYYDQKWLRKNCYTINNKKSICLHTSYGIALYKKI